MRFPWFSRGLPMFFSPFGAAAWRDRSEASPCSRTTAGRPSQSFRGAAA
jgi:hypothetical protein